MYILWVSSVSDNPCSGWYLFSMSTVAPQMHSQSQFNCRILICCTCHFHGDSPFFSLLGLAFSAWKSLQCLISALTWGGQSGHLFVFACSVVLWRERKTLQTNTTGMCGVHLQWMDHMGVAAAWGGMHFPGQSHSGSQVLCEGTVPGGLCILCTFQVQAT